MVALALTSDRAPAKDYLGARDAVQGWDVTSDGRVIELPTLGAFASFQIWAAGLFE